MVVITRKLLLEAAAEYTDAARELAAWFAIVRTARWTSFVDLRGVFPDADAVDGYVIFNIRQNRYRLITVVHWARMRQGVSTQGHVYIRSFLTHRQYDKRSTWDPRATH